MPLTFLNPARSYDPNTQCVRFVGYDGMKSVPFAVEVEALRHVGTSGSSDEVQSLAAFDAARTTVEQVAQEAYANTRQTTYVLTAGDFR